jgi:hypothetical protein
MTDNPIQTRPEAAALHPVGQLRFALLSGGVIAEVLVLAYVGRRGDEEMFAVTAHPPQGWPVAPVPDQASTSLYETRAQALLGKAQVERDHLAQALVQTREQETRLQREVERLDDDLRYLKASARQEKSALARANADPAEAEAAPAPAPRRFRPSFVPPPPSLAVPATPSALWMALYASFLVDLARRGDKGRAFHRSERDAQVASTQSAIQDTNAAIAALQYEIDHPAEEASSGKGPAFRGGT